MIMQTDIKIEKQFYEEAEEVFNKFGLSFTEAINLFLAQVAKEKKIPFDLNVSLSEELKKRITNIKQDKNIQIYNTSQELFKDLGI